MMRGLGRICKYGIICLSIFASSYLYAGVPELERNALIALYDSTDGANWTHNTRWLEDAGTECQWFGVTCDATGTTVISLDLGNYLVGTIPPEIGDLTNLTSLYLGRNQLSGVIPPEIGNLKKLQYLNLSFNQLSGPLPVEIGDMTALQYLDLSSNPLGYYLPAELANLKNLTYLQMSNDQLGSGIPPEFGQLINLDTLILTNNTLDGVIPTELGNLIKLKYLYLYGNQLTGQIPGSLERLQNLVSLRLSDNQLSGEIPPGLASLGKLSYLSLSENQLSGTIPEKLGNLIDLTYLSLSENQLSGSIPASLGNLKNLASLYLNGNMLNGFIPPSLANLKKLSLFTLSLSYNALLADDANLIKYLNAKQPAWQNMQTATPTNVKAIAHSMASLWVYWTPIGYTWDSGNYEVYLSTEKSGPYFLAGITADKAASSMLVTHLTPAPRYYVMVRTGTDPNDNNPNTVYSEFCAEIETPMTAPVASHATDLDGDGETDLLWRNSESNYLYAWILDGTSPSVLESVDVPASDITWSIVCMTDFNNDGKSDILWLDDSDSLLYISLLDGNRVIRTVNVGTIPDLENTTLALVADTSGDGKSDLIFRNTSTGVVTLWIMDGTDIQATITPEATKDTNWNLVQAADFNGDGKSDLIWYDTTTAAVEIWLMDSANLAKSFYAGKMSGAEWSLTGIGDFNADGLSDLLWYNTLTGNLDIWIVEGSDRFEDSPGSMPDLDWQVEGLADFNRDGKTDVLWRNATNGQIQIWTMDGTTLRQTRILSEVMLSGWKIQDLSDLNYDGIADLIWYNAETGEVKFWLMNEQLSPIQILLGIVDDLTWQIV